MMNAAGHVPTTFATIGVHGPATLPAAGVLAARTLRQPDQDTVTWRSRDVAGGEAGGAAARRLGQMTGLAPEGLKPMRAGQPPGGATREALGRCGRHLADTGGTLRAEACSASTDAGSPAQHLVESRLALAGTGGTHVCNRIHDTAIDLPAVAVRKGVKPCTRSSAS